jgi:dienelactone hydrolase
VRVAYPAVSAGDDTEPAGTGFPLVVYAHGVSSSGSGVPGYFQHLAEAGYVVVGPDFPETSRDARNSSDFVEQPADVSLVLDRLIERVSDPNDQLYELFDPERLAISGHSLGGLTAYALAFHDCCRDERFDVVLVYAAVYLFPEGELELSDLPTLFVSGTIDESPGVELMPDFFEQMQGPAYLLTLIDEKHPAGLYGHPKYRRPTNQITVAFLDAYLRDDSAGLEAIEPIDGLYEWRSSR